MKKLVSGIKYLVSSSAFDRQILDTKYFILLMKGITA